MAAYIIHDSSEDGIDRRGFLKCMAWAGTGAFCSWTDVTFVRGSHTLGITDSPLQS